MTVKAELELSSSFLVVFGWPSFDRSSLAYTYRSAMPGNLTSTPPREFGLSVLKSVDVLRLLPDVCCLR